MLVVLKGQKALQKGFGGRQVPPTLSNWSKTHPIPTPRVSSPGRFVPQRTSVLGKETTDIWEYASRFLCIENISWNYSSQIT